PISVGGLRSCHLLLLSWRLLPPLRPTLFPYTTLFRSSDVGERERQDHGGADAPLWRDAGMGGAAEDLRLPMVGAHSGNGDAGSGDRKSTRLNSSHVSISYAVFCLKKKKKQHKHHTSRT